PSPGSRSRNSMGRPSSSDDRGQAAQEGPEAPRFRADIPASPAPRPTLFVSYLIPNTQIAPPSGTSGKLPGDATLRRVCIPRESMPQPDCTAMYCLPATMNDVGWPMMPELVGNSHTSFPLDASNAWNMRSLVPPLNTSPPPVANIGPQFWDFAYGWVHTRAPVSTFHACTSPMWFAPGAIYKVLVTPVKPRPA